MPILEGLREARIALGVREGRPVKVGELAVRVGCSRSHLVSAESGTRPVGEELKAVLESVLGTTLHYVTGSVPDEPPPQPKPQPKPKPRDKGNKGPKRPDTERGAA